MSIAGDVFYFINITTRTSASTTSRGFTHVEFPVFVYSNSCAVLRDCVYYRITLTITSSASYLDHRGILMLGW